MNKRTFLIVALAALYAGALGAQQPAAPPPGAMTMAPGMTTEARAWLDATVRRARPIVLTAGLTNAANAKILTISAADVHCSPSSSATI